MQSRTVPACALKKPIVKSLSPQLYWDVWWLGVALFISFFFAVSMGRSLA
ncbi:MAG TPA: hypothetical protein VE242_07220 [Chthoniobacterales bacterium]|nr:hypothetical protein [Chthoniobacterales bacterium]